MNYLIIAIISFLIFFKDSILDLFRDKTRDPDNYEEIKNHVNPTNPVNFSVWSPDSYKLLINAGYTASARPWSYFVELSNEIKREYGYLVSNDDNILGYIYKVNNAVEFNKLVTAFAGTDAYLQHNFDSLRTFCESELSEDSFNKVKQFVNKLPDGFYRKL